MPGVRKPTILVPVRSNIGVAVWYQEQLRDLLDGMREDILARILAAYDDTENAIGLAQDASDDRAQRVSRAFRLLGRRWISLFDDAASEIATKFSKRAVGHVDTALMASLTRAGFAIRFRPTASSVEAYKTVLAQNVGLIKSIPEQYLSSVQGAVWESVMKGHERRELTLQLMDKYKLTLSRAAAISRDQNNKARTIMENTRFRELGVSEAIWKHSFGGRHPRPSHLAYDGHRYNIEKGAFLDGKWVWPGSEINCGCYARPIIPAFEI